MQVVYRTHPGDGQKKRPDWFSKWSCLKNLLLAFGPHHQFHFIVDGGSRAFAQELYDFAKQYDVAPIVTLINERNNARAFRRMLDYACSLRGVLYLVEDDFLHMPGANLMLDRGIERWDYVTGYDHPDKYVPGGPNHLVMESGGEATMVMVTEHCHWKLTNSTVMTFAVNAETLREDRPVFEKHCDEVCSRSFPTFLELRQTRTIVSSLPAFSTHCETQWMAPLIDWEEVNRQ